MEIDYTNSRNDYVVHSSFASRHIAFHHYYWVVYWAVMAGLGIYASFVAGFIFVAAIIAGMYIVYFVRAVPYSKVLESTVKRTELVSGAKRVRLRLDDNGLLETVEDQVQSFAPWSAIRRFAVVNDHLLIELAGNLWANVPRTTVVQGDAAFDQMVAILRSRQIAEDPASESKQASAPLGIK